VTQQRICAEEGVSTLARWNAVPNVVFLNLHLRWFDAHCSHFDVWTTSYILWTY